MCSQWIANDSWFKQANGEYMFYQDAVLVIDSAFTTDYK